MRSIVFLSLALLAACARPDGPVPSNPETAADAFVGVTDAHSFWMRAHENGTDLRSGSYFFEPYDFRSCLAEQIVKASSVGLADAVENFIQEKSDLNFYTVMVRAEVEMEDSGVGNRILLNCYRTTALDPSADIPKYDSIW